MTRLLLASFIAIGVVGYYVILIIQANERVVATSRALTVPLRVAMLVLLGLILVTNRVIRLSAASRFFGLFSLAYLVRLAFELAAGNQYHIPVPEMLLYFVSFVLLPFVILSSTRVDLRGYDLIFMTLLVSIISLSLLTLYYYGGLLGSVRRISHAVTKDQNYISPLALSYSGALGMGMAVAYAVNHSMRQHMKLFIGSLFCTALIPFYLGASRGSAVALIVSLTLLLGTQSRVSRGVKTGAVLLLGLSVLYLVTGVLGTAVFDRVLGIADDLEAGSSSVVRRDIWKSSFLQFTNSPLFGDSLESTFAEHYPHNVILEALISTGVIGGTPFLLLLWTGVRTAVRVFRTSPSLAWVSVFFVQSLIQNMVSGAIYSASWLFVSFGLLVSADRIAPHEYSSEGEVNDRSSYS